VGFGVVLAGFLGMVHGVKMVAVRNMDVVSGLLVIRAAMMLGGLAVMLGRGFVMAGGFFVMFGELACVHELEPPLQRADLP
jgi:hypothetical protein